jgi:hypothetical protein
MSEALIGARVQVLAGACAGLVGAVTDIKRHANKVGETNAEYRLEFRPPAHVPTVGRMSAVWCRYTDFMVVR